MKRLMVLFMLSAFVLAMAAVSYAADAGTPKEAEALVKKAIAYIKEVGKDKALAEFSNKEGKFVDRDLYIFVYDMTGTVLAHGQNAKMVGKNLIEAKDPDGKEYVKERIALIKEKGKGWQEYKFTDPLTKKIEPKKAYVEKVDDMIVGSGAYTK